MKHSDLLVLLAAVTLTASPVVSDHYETKQDYRNGKLTPSSLGQARAGSDDCASPTRITTTPFSDTGDTTGASDTVAIIPIICNGNYSIVGGPDHIYSFTVTAGNALTFTVSTSDVDYDPSIWTASVCGDGTSCVTGAAADNCFAASVFANPCPDSVETFSTSFLPGTYYFYVDSFYVTPNAANHDAGPYTLTVEGSLPVELLDFAID